MSSLKTRPSENSVAEFIDAVEPEQKRKDCWTLVEMIREITGAEPVMWGSSIVGFDTYVNTPFNTTNPPAHHGFLAPQGQLKRPQRRADGCGLHICLRRAVEGLGDYSGSFVR